jgi:hypothetical protein
MGHICLTVLLSLTTKHTTQTSRPGHNSQKYYTIKAQLLTIHHAANPAALQILQTQRNATSLNCPDQ